MKRLIFILALLLAAFSAAGQDRASATFGLDESDGAALREIRSRMDSIRRHRPTVALVLSGGGAKGGATVGALRYMEQFNFPVDVVVGTSVGGLLGALYSLGYDVDYLEDLIQNIDWDMALSDNVDRQFVPYSRIRYRDRFVLSFPFYYSAEDFQNLIAGDYSTANGEDGRLHLSADNGQANRMVRQNLLGSLPSGYAYGQNVSQIFSSRTVGYSDSTDFFKFPIPFVCVATDIVSGKAKVWHNGSINLAMRSTMSIPGVFAPVRTKGMVLVDGGMRNNFPVDIARDMGADIVIGIDLSTEALGVNDIHNLADIVWRGIDMLAGDSFERSIQMVDVRINPDLEGYNMMSFNSEAIDSMIVRGYKGAEEMDRQLRAVRRWVGSDTLRYQAPPARDLAQGVFVIDSVLITGVSAKEADYLRSKMYIHAGSIVNKQIVEAEVASIFGKGAYDFVTYEMLGTEEPYRLHIRCKKGPMHMFGVGFRIDSEELVSILLNLGLNTNAMSGSSLDMTARVGANPYLNLHYAYDAPKIPTLNLAASVRWTDRNNFLFGTNRYNISYLHVGAEAYLSNMQWSSFDVRGGIRNDYFNIHRVLASDLVGDYNRSMGSMDYPSLFLEGRVETLDDGYFPTQGVSAGFSSSLYSRMAEGTDVPGKFFAAFGMDGKMPVSIGRFTLIPQGAFRFVLGDDIPIPYANVLGGDMWGRYVDHQMPFIGIDNAAFRRNYLIMARMDARFRFGRNHYVSTIANYAFDFYNFNQFEFGEPVWGFGLQYAYNTIVGPLKANLSWSTLTHRVGLYFSLGFDF